MKNLPKISVNIPLISNGDASIVLESLKKIAYPKNRFEIIIVEGNHIARQRNKALDHSIGTICYLLDDDSQVQPDSFKIIAKKFANPKVAAVGGPSLPPRKTKAFFNNLIAYALETYFGAMRMRFRYSKQIKTSGSEYRLLGANLALRKSAVLKVGKFNEKIVPNEETELLRRLSKANYKLIYDEKLFIYRNHRKNIIDLAKQFHHYGKGRMKQIKRVFEFEDLIFILPIGFFLYLITIFFFKPLWWLIPLFLYVLLAFATSVKASLKYKKADLIFSMSFIFPIIHLSYAAGLLDELVLTTFSRPQNQKDTEELKTTIIKGDNHKEE